MNRRTLLTLPVLGAGLRGQAKIDDPSPERPPLLPRPVNPAGGAE